jgi:hypothetical protein
MVSIQNWVHHQYIVSLRIVKVSLVRYVVEIRELFGEGASILTLLKDVLFLIPQPGWVNFAEILDNQAARLDALLSLAKDAHAF